MNNPCVLTGNNRKGRFSFYFFKHVHTIRPRYIIYFKIVAYRKHYAKIRKGGSLHAAVCFQYKYEPASEEAFQTIYVYDFASDHHAWPIGCADMFIAGYGTKWGCPFF